MALVDRQPDQPTGDQHTILPEFMDPSDAEKIFHPQPAQPDAPPPMKVDFAQNDAAPIQSDAQPAGAQSQPQSLISPNDSRYGDEQWIIMNNLITQGALPWLQAAADVAAGRVTPEQFEQVRVEHSKRVQQIMDSHPDFVQSAQKAMPFLTGLGLGIFKPAESTLGTVTRGLGAGGAIGAVQGYTGGEPETPSLSRERAVSAVEGAAQGGFLGAAGATAGVAARGVVKGAREVGKMREADRATREAQDAADARREAARQKAAKTRATAKAEAEQQANLAAHFDDYRKPPSNPIDEWQSVRKQFEQDPGRVWDHFTTTYSRPTLSELSDSTNLPQAVLAKRLSKFNLKVQTPEQLRLKQEVDHVMEAWNAYKSQRAVSKTPSSTKPVRAKPEPAAPVQEFTEPAPGPYRGPALERLKQEKGQ